MTDTAAATGTIRNLFIRAASQGATYAEQRDLYRTLLDEMNEALAATADPFEQTGSDQCSR